MKVGIADVDTSGKRFIWKDSWENGSWMIDQHEYGKSDHMIVFTREDVKGVIWLKMSYHAWMNPLPKETYLEIIWDSKDSFTLKVQWPFSLSQGFAIVLAS